MPPAGFDPPGEKWQLCLYIVVALPPKPPRLDYGGHLSGFQWLGFRISDPICLREGIHEVDVLEHYQLLC